ncbi:MAG: HAD-IIIA family hydrolase, partial [Phycisphaerales bacterium]
NVSVDDLRKALAILPREAYATVQNQLNPFDTASARGIVALTREHGLTLLAHSPLGGHAGVHRIQKKDALAEVATRHGLDASAGRHPVALSWLMTLGAHVIPVFGATRQTSVEASFAALQLQLSDDDLKLLDETFPKAAALRDEPLPAAPAGALLSESASAIEVSAEPLPAPGDAPEIVMILGIPGAGKSSLVAPYLDKGYLRLNRDELGGKLDDLVPALRNALASGRKRVVLDNTYPTLKSRLGVLESGRLANVPVRCLWLDTTLEDARWNACLRMLERHGRLLSPDEIAVLSKTEPNTIPPVAQQVWLKNFEPPSGHEGFAQIERRPFVRHARPDRTKRGLLLDVDGTLRVTRSGEKYPRDVGDVMLLPNRRQILAEWHQQGYRLFFVSNQSGISSGKLESRNAEAAFHRTIELLNLPVDDVAYCPHKAFPVSCFCRKPMPGLAVKLIEKHGLALEHLHIVGDMKSDAELARAIGAIYHEAHEFFGDPPPR